MVSAWGEGERAAKFSARTTITFLTRAVRHPRAVGRLQSKLRDVFVEELKSSPSKAAGSSGKVLWRGPGRPQRHWSSDTRALR